MSGNSLGMLQLIHWASPKSSAPLAMSFLHTRQLRVLVPALSQITENAESALEPRVKLQQIQIFERPFARYGLESNYVRILLIIQDTNEYSAEKLCDQIGMFIVACRLPFNIVSHVHFNCMIQQAARSSTISIPTCQKVRDRILELSQLRHAEELSRIPADSKVSLALDCWTSPQWKAFLAVTGYYINTNFESKEVLLGFEPISGSHSGIKLANCVLGVLEDAKLDR